MLKEYHDFRELPGVQLLCEDNENVILLPACIQNEGIYDYASGIEF